MIEVKVDGTRMTGYQGNNTAVNKGSFMYTAGEFAAAHVPVGTPGYNRLGDMRMLPAVAVTHSGFGVFPVNKLILATEGADQSLDTIASGLSLLFYIGGEYETDEYDITVSGVGTVAGTQLWLNDSGQIATSSASDYDANFGLPPIGEVVSVSDFPSTNNWYNGGNDSGVDSFKKTVRYRLYPSHAAPAVQNGNAT